MNDFFNSRGFLTISALIAAVVVLTTTGLVGADIGADDGWRGLFFAFSDSDLPSGLPPLLNLVCLATITTLLILLNKQYNFIRAYTLLFGSLFLLLSAASVWLEPHAFNIGLVLALVLVAVMFVIFGEYQNAGHAQRSIYLAFTAVGACCLFHYASLFLIPVVLIGFAQVRAMSAKGLMAMLLGLVTPAWLVIGLGIVDPLAQFQRPDVSAIWAGADIKHLQLPIIMAAITALVTIIITSVNLMTVLNYRLQTRMYNAFIVVAALLSILAMCFDFTHILIYLPILNVCLAIQVAHRATVGRRQ